MSRFRLHFLLVLATFALANCGSKTQPGDGGGPKLSRTEEAFLKASRETGVPARLMMAAGYLESRLSAQNASATYVTIDGDDQPTLRGTLMTQTAFGLTYETLKLDPLKPQSSTLEAQIDAYAHWLKDQVKAAGLNLAAEPKTGEDQFYWLETMANLHRAGADGRNNVRIIFAKELIDILNQGFIWQDTRSGEKLVLEKETPPINPDKFSDNGKVWMQLDLTEAKFIDVVDFRLATTPPDQYINHPTHIEVIHCPLSLSGCLELQTRMQESDVSIAAHYIIPQLDPDLRAKGHEVFSKILRVAKELEPVRLTDAKGETQWVTDAVVVMLVGNSGRPVQGSRRPAIPTWFTDAQLRALGSLVNDLCTQMAHDDPQHVDRDDCMRPSSGGDKGVHFHRQAKSEEYRWGDIPDYDDTIFNAYLRAKGALTSAVKFQFEDAKREFRAGNTIPLRVNFDSNARSVELERLVRCAGSDSFGGKVVWEPVRSQQLRGETRATFDEVFHDSGPNRNGDQFFRVRVYGGSKNALIGWSIDRIYLSAFEPEVTFGSEKVCSDE